MQLLTNRRSRKAGLPPGSLVYIGDQPAVPATITVIDFDEQSLREHAPGSAAECRAFLGGDTVSWINVTGLHDTDLLGDLGELLDIHSLVLEDILNTGQRPRMEDFSNYAFIVLKMLQLESRSDTPIAEQVSLIMGPHYVISFQERPGDVFDAVRDRLRKSKGRIRCMGSDYLTYSLVDAIVDGYFIVLESVGDRVEALEDQALTSADAASLQQIHALKRELVMMRKGLWPLRELVRHFSDTEGKLVSDALAPYLKDLYEHTIQVIESVEMLRELLASTLDIYMTTVSNRMNDVMKVLTIIATIFIPLTFIAGIYGMNFEHMPELQWRGSYACVWLLMISMALGMLAFFKRKGWL